jgi:hypothetical protein
MMQMVGSFAEFERAMLKQGSRSHTINPGPFLRSHETSSSVARDEASVSQPENSSVAGAEPRKDRDGARGHDDSRWLWLRRCSS